MSGLAGGRRGRRRAALALLAVSACGCDPAPRMEVYVRRPLASEGVRLLADGSAERPYERLDRGYDRTLPGGVLHLGAGVYDGPLRIDKPIRIAAMKGARPVIESAGEPLGVRIQDAKASLQGVTIRPPRAEGKELRSTEGLSIRGKSDVTIQNVTVAGFRTGVRMELTEGAVVIVQDSEVRDSADYGIVAVGNGEVLLTNNIVTGSGVTGMSAADRVRFKMIKNRVSRSGNFGVEIGPRAEGEMTGNYIERSGLSGVAFRTPGRLVVTKNESVENHAFGFACLAKGDLECSGNVAERNDQGGLDEPCKEACTP